MTGDKAIITVLTLFLLASAGVNYTAIWHISEIHDRIRKLESIEPTWKGRTLSEIRATGPTAQEVSDYIGSNNGSAPPASWYPKGDPWNNFTAEESEEWLKGCEAVK